MKSNDTRSTGLSPGAGEERVEANEMVLRAFGVFT